jgi:hypothetical protein
MRPRDPASVCPIEDDVDLARLFRDTVDVVYGDVIERNYHTMPSVTDDAVVRRSLPLFFSTFRVSSAHGH